MSKGALVWPLLALLAALIVRRWLDVVEVRGHSMTPALQPGDRLLVARVARPRVGDVVLAADPRAPHRELVKRITDVTPVGITLRGDNRARSTDARTFGALPRSAVRWRVVGRYWPPGRAGRVAPSAISHPAGGGAGGTLARARIGVD